MLFLNKENNHIRKGAVSDLSHFRETLFPTNLSKLVTGNPLLTQWT